MEIADSTKKELRIKIITLEERTEHCLKYGDRTKGNIAM